jgi:hypothetical protein
LSDTPLAVRTYAQRRLSPFMGTVQVVEVADGRALSYDGWLWHIQLRSQEPIANRVWGNIGPRQTSRPYFHYGSWTQDGDLRRLPLNPVLGDVSGYAALAALLEALNQHPPLPFPLHDRYECWVLDRAGEPVVLFASACDEAARNVPPHPRWQASQAGGPEFRSAALDAAGACVDKPHAAWLVDVVSRSVGTPLSLQWFRREDDGSGVGLDGKHLRPEWLTRQLPATAFPPLLLRESWEDPLTAAVVQEYLVWQAPYLLMLAELSDDQRRRLELQACHRPVQLMSARRLLPRILDRELIDTALVRARLESVAGAVDQADS